MHSAYRKFAFIVWNPYTETRTTMRYRRTNEVNVKNIWINHINHQSMTKRRTEWNKTKLWKCLTAYSPRLLIVPDHARRKYAGGIRSRQPYKRHPEQDLRRATAWWLSTVWILNYVDISHYDDVIMSTKASKITSQSTRLCTQPFIRAQIKKYQSSASLAFARGIHRWLMNSPHKWSVMRKMFPFDDVIML